MNGAHTHTIIFMVQKYMGVLNTWDSQNGRFRVENPNIDMAWNDMDDLD